MIGKMDYTISNTPRHPMGRGFMPTIGLPVPIVPPDAGRREGNRTAHTIKPRRFLYGTLGYYAALCGTTRVTFAH